MTSIARAKGRNQYILWWSRRAPWWVTSHKRSLWYSPHMHHRNISLPSLDSSGPAQRDSPGLGKPTASAGFLNMKHALSSCLPKTLANYSWHGAVWLDKFREYVRNLGRVICEKHSLLSNRKIKLKLHWSLQLGVFKRCALTQEYMTLGFKSYRIHCCCCLVA